MTRDVTWRPVQRRAARRLRPRTGLVILAALLGVNVAVILYHGDPREQLPAARSAAPAEAAGPPAPAQPGRRTSLRLGEVEGLAAEVDPTVGMRTPSVVQRVAVTELGRGQTVAAALLGVGAAPGEVGPALQSLSGIIDFRRLWPGHQLKARFDGDGALLSVDVHAGMLERARAERRDGGWVAKPLEVRVDTVEAQVSGTVVSSLWEATVGRGERPKLVSEVVEIFGWDIDFYRDVHPGDTFRLVVDKRYVDEEFVGYGPVHVAEFVSGGAVHRAFRFTRADGGTAYYDAAGQSLRKQLLKSPLEYGRMTSGYGTRQHPILGYSRAHNGVDYGVPTGTPVWSVGDGTVVRAGWSDGFGKIIEIRHPNGWQSQYAHLSAIDVRVGQRVFQKDVVGKVGSTGLSTGPHLHYGLKYNGSYVNPAAQTFERGKPLIGADLESFTRTAAELATKLEHIQVAGVGPAAAERG